MQVPILANTSEYYKLVSEALLASNRAYGSIQEFYRDEFMDAFTGAEWASLLEVGEENRTGKFTQVIGNRQVPVMAAWVADDGEAPLISNEGFEIQTKTFPRMKLAYNFNEKSAEEGEYIASMGGIPNLQSIFNAFRRDNMSLIAGIHVLRSYATYQMESTCKILTNADNRANGLKGMLIDFQHPAENKFKAGFGGLKKAWSDPDADPCQDLVDLVKIAKDRKIPFGVLRMNETTYDTLMDHPNTKKRVAMWVTNYLVPEANLSQISVDYDSVERYLSKALRLPVIEVVKYTATMQALDPETQSIKKVPKVAFADNTVLLRPAGKIGYFDWKKPTSLFATTANPMYFADENRIGIQQEIYSTRKAMQFTAESIGAPVPYDISEWLYLITNVAAS